MIICTADLQDRLNDPSYVVFDCRHDLADPTAGAVMYAGGHLPGARFAGVDTMLSSRPTGANGRHPLPDPAAFAAALADAGVTAATTIVAYDQVGGQYAARLWWLARWIGHRNAAVLDGGWPKWLAEGRPISTAVPAVARGSLSARPDRRHWLSVEEIQSVSPLIVDARAPERYRGEVEPIDPVAGHIPGAINRFFKSNLEPDLTFRDPAALRSEWLGVIGDRPTSDVAHQCGSGITACVNLLAMELAGLSGSKLYAGSWSEWVADPSRPVVGVKG